jgi:hypothetical protein
MTPEFSYDVFLSHSSKDKHIVRRLAERLRNDGLKVWFEEWSIRAGDNVYDKTEEGLQQSRVLVMYGSANAFGADLRQLAHQAFRFRDLRNKKRRFVLLRVDQAPISPSLSEDLSIKWSVPEHDKHYEELMEACRSPKDNTTANETDCDETEIPRDVLSSSEALT